MSTASPPPMVLATGSQDDVPSTPPEKRLRLGSGNGGDGGGGGGGGGAGVAHGRRRFNGESIYFDDPIAMGLDSSLRYRELLEPAGRLQGLMVVTGDVNLPRLAELFAGIPGTFSDPPYLFFHQGNVDPDNKQRNIQYSAEQVKQVLDLASPEVTAAVGGWRAIQCPDDDGMSRLHANLLIARFAGAGHDNPSFLRVYVGSANCSVERGVAFDSYWVQDFPVTAAPGAPPTDLPHRHKDPQPFRLTLRCFIKELIRQRFPSEDERPDLLASLGVFVRLLKDVDFSGAKGTLIASLPKRGLSYHPCTNWDGPVQFNAVRGLSKALGRYLWPEAARGTPINYLTGALGNMANRPWLESLVHGAMAGGGHGPAVDAAGELRLRVVWPTNDTAFRAVHSDEAELATRSLAHNWRYGEDGQDFPYQLFYDAEPKFAVNPAPPSHAVVLYRVAPWNSPLPAGGNGIRGWVVVGSANLAKCAWAIDLEREREPPTTFELSVLLTTPHPSVAARWLDAIPLKLPGGLSRTGLERTVVDAERYVAPGAQVVNTPRNAGRAPFNYARDQEAEFDGMWAALFGFV